MKVVNNAQRLLTLTLLGVVAGLAPVVGTAAEQPEEQIRIASLNTTLLQAQAALESGINRMNADLLEDLQDDLELRLRSQIEKASEHLHMPITGLTHQGS